MTASRPRVLWITNMLPDPDVPGARGIFVGQQYEAIRSRGTADLEVMQVAGKRGGADYFLANLRVGKRWRNGGFDLAHVHYGLTGLATFSFPGTSPWSSPSTEATSTCPVSGRSAGGWQGGPGVGSLSLGAWPTNGLRSETSSVPTVLTSKSAVPSPERKRAGPWIWILPGSGSCSVPVPGMR